MPGHCSSKAQDIVKQPESRANACWHTRLSDLPPQSAEGASCCLWEAQQGEPGGEHTCMIEHGKLNLGRQHGGKVRQRADESCMIQMIV